MSNLVDLAVFPGNQGGPLEHIIGAKGIAFGEALQDSFLNYINQVKINHYDLFRIKSSEEIKKLDLFGDIMNSILLIEWPQIIEKKPRDLIELNFEYGKDHQERSVQIKGLIL